MKFPYDEYTLLKALTSIEKQNLYNDEVAEKIEAKLDNITIEDKAELNKKIAEFNNISVTTLLNSSNYENLRDEFVAYTFKKIVDVFKDEGKFSDEQAWAIVLLGTGYLNVFNNLQ